jgi:tetratricopeptide (TPR) repeat protein
MSDPLYERLETLETAGLVRVLSGQGEPEYQFRHALTHEAAYSSLTKQRRRQLHLVIGQCLEALHPGREIEIAELLAYHFAVAGEAEPACRYALLAADRAVSTFAYDEALAYLERALKTVGEEGPAEPRLGVLEALGDVHSLLRQGSQALGRFLGALDAWKGIPDASQTDFLRLHRKIVHVSTEMKWAVEMRDFEALRLASEASRRSLESASRVLESEAPHPETVRIMTVLSNAAWRMESRPDWDAALRHAQSAVRVGERLGSAVDLSPALGALSAAAFAHGQLRLSLDTALQRLDLTQQPSFSDVRERLDSLRGAGSAWMYVGGYSQAIPLLLEAESLASRVQAVDQRFNALSLLTQCWFRLDRWQDLLAREADWEEIERLFPQERTGPVCFPLALRAAVHARRGDSAEAEALADRSMRIMLGTWGSSNWLRNAHY